MLASFDVTTRFGWSDFIPQLTVNMSGQRQYFQFPNAMFTQYEAGSTVIVGLRGKF